MPFQTEFPFTLPRGYVDPDGNLHREGFEEGTAVYVREMPDAPVRSRRRTHPHHPDGGRVQRVGGCSPYPAGNEHRLQRPAIA